MVCRNWPTAVAVEADSVQLCVSFSLPHRRAKAIADSCTPCDAPLVRFVCIFWTRILSHVYEIIFLSTLRRISKNTHPFVCVLASHDIDKKLCSRLSFWGKTELRLLFYVHVS